MCGLVGIVSERNVAPLLLTGLKHLEYRGFDASSIYLLENNRIELHETIKSVEELEKALDLERLLSKVGIASSQWLVGSDIKDGKEHKYLSNVKMGLVVNGLIENSVFLKKYLFDQGYEIDLDNASEIISTLIYSYIQSGATYLDAVRRADKEIEGIFSIILIKETQPNSLIALHRGSQLVLGLGVYENYIASDANALLHLTDKIVYLEEGDIVNVTDSIITIYDKNNKETYREAYVQDNKSKKGKYSHPMLKEIYDQPDSILNTIQDRVNDKEIVVDAFGSDAVEFFSRVHRVRISASGTSYHAALVGRYWLEEIAGIPCQVDMASEYRYREYLIEPNTLFVSLSQTGETAETVNALRLAKSLSYIATLAISNVPDSTLVKESDLTLITAEGKDTSESSVKDFTVQLSALLLLTLSLGRYHRLTAENEAVLAKKLRNLPLKFQKTLHLDSTIKSVAPKLTQQQRALFLSHGINLPVAMEGAMRLKQVSSIIADVKMTDEFNQMQLEKTDPQIPILALSPTEAFYDIYLPKLRDWGGYMIVLTDEKYGIQDSQGLKMINLPSIDEWFMPMTYVIPMQLLAYHVATMKTEAQKQMMF